MPRGKAECVQCGADLTDADDIDSFVTFFSGSMGGDRADMHLSCPECENHLQAEIKVVNMTGG